MVGAEENVCHDDNLYDHVLTCNVLFNLGSIRLIRVHWTWTGSAC